MQFADVRDSPEYLIRRGMATRQTIVGCTQAEIGEVCRVQGVDSLPQQYELFLLLAGRRAGQFLRGTDFYFPDQADEEFVAHAHELLTENKVSHLMKPGSVVMGMHQGYQIYWIEPVGAVNFYSETETSVRRTWTTLAEFLFNEAEREANLLEYIHKNDFTIT